MECFLNFDSTQKYLCVEIDVWLFHVIFFYFIRLMLIDKRWSKIHQNRCTIFIDEFINEVKIEFFFMEIRSTVIS